MIFWIYSGQSYIPQGVITRCYSTSDCSDAGNEEFNQLFDTSIFDINHCCYDASLSTPRTNIEALYFTLNGGGCRSCDRKVMHAQILLYNMVINL